MTALQKNPYAALRFISRRSDVLAVRLFAKDSHALHMNFLQRRLVKKWR
jgi:hypothetical protein